MTQNFEKAFQYGAQWKHRVSLEHGW